MSAVNFKFTKSQIDSFFDMIKHNKEFGGVFRIEDNKITNFTKEKGGNYSVRYNHKNHTYPISYHTHAYYPSMMKQTSETIFKQIDKQLSTNTNNALYLFECDIMKIHPPSPQDCYVCSQKYKYGMIVFTQEGIYQVKYYGHKPLTLDEKNKIDLKYYSYIWGQTRQTVENCLQSGNHKKILNCLKKCAQYRKTHENEKCIEKYLKMLKKYNIECKLVKWNEAYHNVFFS